LLCVLRDRCAGLINLIVSAAGLTVLMFQHLSSRLVAPRPSAFGPRTIKSDDSVYLVSDRTLFRSWAGLTTSQSFPQDKIQGMSSLFWEGLIKASPISVTYFTNDPQIRVIREIFQSSDKICE
jgi:hypothetical protein